MASLNRREWTITGKDGQPHKQLRWDCQVYLGRDEAGRVRFKTKTFARLSDAKAWAATQEVQRAQLGPGAASREARETLGALLRHWLTTKEGQVRVRTLVDYRAALFRFVLRRAPEDPKRRPEPPADAPRLADVRLDKLTPQGLEVAYHWWRAKGKSARTIRCLNAIISQALSSAVRKGAIPRNPASLVDLPARERRDDDGDHAVHAFTKEQATAFLAAARTDRLSALWHVLLLGGLRPGEAFGLKWGDVDFEQRRIRVVRSLTRVSGIKGWSLTEPKTKNARRSVPLPPVAMAELRAWKRKQAEERLALGPEWQNHGFVFTTPHGAPLHGANLHGSSFKAVMGAANLGTWGEQPKRKHASGPLPKRPFTPAFRMYDLRHSAATLLLLAGESVKVVSERLGHASVTLTLDTYSHVLPDMQEQAAAKLEAMFGTGAK